MVRLFFMLAIFSVALRSFAQNYSSYSDIGKRAAALEAMYPALVKLQSIAKTAGGKDIWVLEIGSGERSSHPALAVVGGVEGAHLLGQELALGFAEYILKNSQQDSIRNLLGSTTFYVFPSVSPDAAEQYFAALKYERSGNVTPTDDDRDGRLNEDPFEDMNGDGTISWVRIESPEGKWKSHPADERVMVMANPEKGEQGKYIFLQEGTDNDKDLKWNEDGEGGIHFNKSLPFDHPYFAPGAGENPVSETENRALLDYLYAHFNVFAVLSFGPSNNLSEPWKFDKSKTTQRVINGILEADATINKMASDLYKKHYAAKDAPAAGPSKGDFHQWAYYHYGRQSFSTPGWWVPKFELPKDSAAAKKIKPNEDKNSDVEFLRWAESEGLDVFIPWKKVSHPDYPGKNAEDGGFKPFVKSNPPYKLVGKLTEDHAHFILALAWRKPGIELINLKTESLGSGVSRITVTVRNPGLFPAVADIALNNYWIKQVKVTLSIAKEKIITGNKVTLLPNLLGGESKELSWLVNSMEKITLEAGAPQTGVQRLEITF